MCGSMARMVPKGSRSELVDRFSIPSEKCRIRLLKHMMKPSLLLMRGGRELIVTYIFGHMLPQKCNLHFLIYLDKCNLHF